MVDPARKLDKAASRPLSCCTSLTQVGFFMSSIDDLHHLPFFLHKKDNKRGIISFDHCNSCLN